MDKQADGRVDGGTRARRQGLFSRTVRADLLAKGTIASYELAIKANPRWGEPHFQHGGAAIRIRRARISGAENRGHARTAQRRILADARRGANGRNQYADAEKSWTAAMKAAPTEAERARIRQVRVGYG